MNYHSNFEFKSEKQRNKVMAILRQRGGGGKVLEGQINARRILSERDRTENLVTKKRRVLLLEKLQKPHVVITEGEIQNIKNNFNGGSDEGYKFAKEANTLIWDHPNGVRLTEEQNQKGVEYLNRPNIRKQMGYREEHVIDNFKEFKLDGFKDEANYHQNQMGIRYYVPVFTVIANDGNTFQYHGSSGGISITG